MNINDAFPRRYLNGADLPEEPLPVTIEKITLEEVGRDKETKPVIYFSELDKGLICNKTNARSIARALGSEDFDDWVSGRIQLYKTEVEFGGEIYEGIRIKGIKPVEKPQKPAGPHSVPITQRKAVPVPSDEVDEDGIPF